MVKTIGFRKPTYNVPHQPQGPFSRLQSHLVTSELCDEVIEKSVVEIFTSEEGVAVGWLNLENSLLDFQNTNIEGSTAKIENSDTKNKTKLGYIPEDENN